ncbi:MAG TPA: hypothetical protein VK838_00960 [Candidatus Limnocylindrales bacterium]|nr:hypothetical protein [Candidatus Limnocylindrales bacterium]
MLVAGLALHELWISFRLLLVVGVVMLASLPAALVPHSTAPNLAGAPPDSLGWFAIALAAAMVAVAALAAGTLAYERRRGTAGWMAVRAVPRSVILLAWFAAFGLLVTAALVPAGLVGWFSLVNALPPTGPGPFIAALLACGMAGLAALALAMLAGSLLPPPFAIVATALLAGPPLLGAATGQWGLAALPGGGLAVLAGLGGATRPIADALLSAGVALSLTAVLLVAAAAAFERADL